MLHCTQYEPEKRPSIEDVVSKLQNMLVQQPEQVSGKSKNMDHHREAHLPMIISAKKMIKEGSSPWTSGSAVATALETLASRLDDRESLALTALSQKVTADLGEGATHRSGAFNPARLYYFLCITEMDVSDAKTEIVQNSNARTEFKVDAMMKRIVREDLCFHTLPRMAEYLKFQPFNLNVSRSKNGSNVSYINYGKKCDFEGLKKAFSIEEYINGE